jgi:hypothetical protein
MQPPETNLYAHLHARALAAEATNHRHFCLVRFGDSRGPSWDTCCGNPSDRGVAHEVTLAGVYWIAVLSPTGTATLRFRARTSSGGATEVSAQSTLATLPATWTSGAVFRDGPLSAYGSS